jgi:hypothetical protein
VQLFEACEVCGGSGEMRTPVSEEMRHRGRPWSELARARYSAFHGRLAEVKLWREREHDEGRPCGLEDFFRAHGLCFACKSTGTRLSPIGFDGDIPLFEECEVCGGSGEMKTM